MDTIELIQQAAESNPSKFQDAFNALMATKVADAVAAKKIEVAQQYFAAPQQEPETEASQ